MGRFRLTEHTVLSHGSVPSMAEAWLGGASLWTESAHLLQSCHEWKKLKELCKIFCCETNLGDIEVPFSSSVSRCLIMLNSKCLEFDLCVLVFIGIVL